MKLHPPFPPQEQLLEPLSVEGALAHPLSSRCSIGRVPASRVTSPGAWMGLRLRINHYQITQGCVMIALLDIFTDEEESSSAGLALLRDLDVPYEEY